MLTALRQRNFGLLWFGQLVSMTGDWVLFIALPFYIFSLTGSALATGIMLYSVNHDLMNGICGFGTEIYLSKLT